MLSIQAPGLPLTRSGRANRMKSVAVAQLEADYLVVGAGAVGMAFTDALVDHADVSVVMVDRRSSGSSGSAISAMSSRAGWFSPGARPPSPGTP